MNEENELKQLTEKVIIKYFCPVCKEEIRCDNKKNADLHLEECKQEYAEIEKQKQDSQFYEIVISKECYEWTTYIIEVKEGEHLNNDNLKDYIQEHADDLIEIDVKNEWQNPIDNMAELSKISKEDYIKESLKQKKQEEASNE